MGRWGSTSIRFRCLDRFVVVQSDKTSRRPGREEGGAELPLKRRRRKLPKRVERAEAFESREARRTMRYKSDTIFAWSALPPSSMPLSSEARFRDSALAGSFAIMKHSSRGMRPFDQTPEMPRHSTNKPKSPDAVVPTKLCGRLGGPTPRWQKYQIGDSVRRKPNPRPSDARAHIYTSSQSA